MTARAACRVTNRTLDGDAGDIVTRNPRQKWLIAGLTVLAAVVLAAGIAIGLRVGNHNGAKPPTTPAATTLADDFTRLQTKIHAVAGIALSAVGTEQTPITLGSLQSGSAWSTIKVPLTIAALREGNPPHVTDAMVRAITASDTEAAETIWAGLGDPATAADKVDAVLRATGDPTTVQSQRVRPEFSAFGQTEWSLTDQVRFTSVAVCDEANTPIFDLMGRIVPDQSWGLGTIAGTRFKGGWGPSTTGTYLVRQMGVLTTPTGMVAVAIAVQPDAGTFQAGTAALTDIATWLTAHLSALPGGRCP